MTPEENRNRDKTPTDWELGNELLCRVMDAQSDLAEQLKFKHPKIANHLRRQRQQLVASYRMLVGEKALA